MAYSQEKQLYSHENATLLLGCILNDPSIIDSGRYPLDREDFEPCLFHKVLFAVIENLVYNEGVSQIDEVVVDRFVSQYPEIKEILEDNNFMEVIPTLKEISKSGTFKFYYNNIRKFSLLRHYSSNGFNVSSFYNVDFDDQKELEKLAKYTINEIVDYFETIQEKARRKFLQNDDIEEVKVGTSFDNYYELYKEKPQVGASFFSDYFNSATNGFQEGQMTVISASSGIGKTSIGIATLAKIAATELWDDKEQRFIKNPCCQHQPVLYCQFEMELQSQCTPKFISYVSGVSSKKIMRGKCTPEEEMRVKRAMEILEESNVYEVLIPSFTKSKIESIVRDYVLNKGVKYLFWDYIQEGGAINREIQKENNTATSGYQVLTALSDFLKSLCIKYKIAVYTGTQVNKEGVNEAIVNERAIMGGAGVAFKADIGAVMLRLREREWKCFHAWQEQHPSFEYDPKGLRCIHLYKSRFGDEEPNLRIFIYCDLSTGRCQDLFVVDMDGAPYRLNKTKLEADHE